MLRHGFEAGFNEATTRPQLCRDAILGSVEVWFEAGFNIASKNYQFCVRSAEMYYQGVLRHGFEAGLNEA